jgi:aminoglycoside 3-N-acetyltransferase
VAEDSRSAIEPGELAAQLRALGVRAGGTLVVHASFRAVGPVAGGPAGLIGALRDALGSGGTLVMPTMTGSRKGEPYDPRTTPTSDMGVVAETFWRMPGVARSDHPTSSFAATGRWADLVVAPQPLEPVHGPDSPIGRVHALAGSVLLLGVGHNVNTTIHLAECLADVPYALTKWCTLIEDGRPVRRSFREQDHCTQRFALVEPPLRERGAQRESTVGRAGARLVASCAVVDAALDLLRASPTALLHPPGSGCEECEAAWGSIGVGWTRPRHS